MTAYELAKAEEEKRLAEIEKSIVPTRFDHWTEEPRRMKAWRTADKRFSGTVTMEEVRVKGYTPWVAVREMTSQAGRMKCVAWVLYLIEQNRGSIKKLEEK